MGIIEKARGPTDEPEPHPGNPFIASDHTVRSSSDSDHDEDTQAGDPGIVHNVEDEKESILPKLALPFALLVGAAIMGGGTYAVVAYVQNLVANAAVDDDEAKWVRLARTDAYDGCYLGCTSCDDPDFAYKACQLTTRVNVKGVICDANKMWNWAVEDRYPRECLKAVSKVIMGDALEDLKNHYRKRFAIVTVTILGGLGIGVLVYFLWHKFTKPKKLANPWSSQSQTTPASFCIKRPATWKLPKKEKHHKAKTEKTEKITATTTTTEPTTSTSHAEVAAVPVVSQSYSSSSRTSSAHSARRIPTPYSPPTFTRRDSSPTPPTFDIPRRSSSSSRSSHSGPRLSILIGAALTLTTSGASASICVRDQPWTQHFITSKLSSSQKTITGTIHGWFSECYQVQKCKQKCRYTCSGGSCGNKCTKECHMEDKTSKEPKVFVDAAIPLVTKCGFKMVDTLSGGETPTVRVANSEIERGLYVRISVSGYNVTDAKRTDGSVDCLHGLGDL
ncbi:hypothetical protein QBC36DRAFT_303282 [Triangularia setosa]|uniref:Uncharacterized protein n=1 Tax=Triangularia setosa TaxID=2587417 RepID=A0AAN6W1W2_9PEZI|nr:hypothetical protein QBC36DRAFT_303282 [Podospora setosa]